MQPLQPHPREMLNLMTLTHINGNTFYKPINQFSQLYLAVFWSHYFRILPWKKASTFAGFEAWEMWAMLIKKTRIHAVWITMHSAMLLLVTSPSGTSKHLLLITEFVHFLGFQIYSEPAVWCLEYSPSHRGVKCIRISSKSGWKWPRFSKDWTTQVSCMHCVRGRSMWCVDGEDSLLGRWLGSSRSGQLTSIQGKTPYLAASAAEAVWESETGQLLPASGEQLKLDLAWLGHCV